MAGMQVVVAKLWKTENIDVEGFKRKSDFTQRQFILFDGNLSFYAWGFEAAIIEVTKIIHDNGGQVYMDGANYERAVGLTNPTIGADVCHLNLHKTFAIHMVAVDLALAQSAWRNNWFRSYQPIQ